MGQEIPAPTLLAQLAVQPNERAVLIDVYMPSVRQAAFIGRLTEL